MAKTNYGPFIVVGLLAIGVGIGLGVYFASRSNRSQTSTRSVNSYTNENGFVITPVKEKRIAKQPAFQEPLSTYENEEVITFPEGFDPDTLMPVKIVIHRNAKVRHV